MTVPEGVVGVHHFSFTVEDLDRAVDFYTNMLGFELRSRGAYQGDSAVGAVLLGDSGKEEVNQGVNAEIALLELTGTRIEFMQWLTPGLAPCREGVSTVAAAHIGIRVKSIVDVRRSLEEAGVSFPSPVELFAEVGHRPWQECAFRDPNGIVVELIQDPSVTTLVEVLGSRIRRARLARGLTLKEAASMSEISTAHLSQVERGDAIPSLPALIAVSATLGVAPEYFLRSDGEHANGDEGTGGTQSPTRQAGANGVAKDVRVIAPGEGQVLSVTGGVEWHWMTGSDEPVRVVQASYEVGAVSEDLGLGQEGTETGVIIEGSLTIELEGHPRVLEAGSSISYPRSTRRRFENVGAVRAVAIWVIADGLSTKPG